MGAKNVSDLLLKDRGDKKQGNDKIRFIFSIESQEQALECFDYFTKRFYSKNKRPANDDLDIEQSIMIYLQKDEEVFVKYGDEEA